MGIHPIVEPFVERPSVAVTARSQYSGVPHVQQHDGRDRTNLDGRPMSLPDTADSHAVVVEGAHPGTARTG
jgi:hypothetical protein